MIEPTTVRTLTLTEPSRPGRPAHVSAASGLVRARDKLYVVVDDENHLAVFDAGGSQPGSLRKIFAGVLPNDPQARKRNKPDAECAVRVPPLAGYDYGALLVLGSCSRRQRCQSVLLGLDAQGELDGTRLDVDLSPLHDALDGALGGLNIEGAVALGGELVLLQRGGKGKRRGAMIRMELARSLERLATQQCLGTEALIAVQEVALGSLGDVPLGFTDGAALPDGRVLFTAVAEDTKDSYSDGPCFAAAIGIVDLAGRVDRLEPITSPHKVEGIDAAVAGGSIEALVVTDADDANVPAMLLSCELRV